MTTMIGLDYIIGAMHCSRTLFANIKQLVRFMFLPYVDH